MSNMDATAGLATQPGPQQDRTSKFAPDGIVFVLPLIQILLAYGNHLLATLEHRATQRSFSIIAEAFGTARLPLIIARLTRGIRRAIALERILLARAASGRDLVAKHLDDYVPRRKRPPAQKAATDSQQEHKQPRVARRAGRDEDLDPNAIPSIEQLMAAIRRRPVGRTLVDICCDLGIAFDLCDGAFGTELYQAITWHRGSFTSYFKAIRRRQKVYADEWDRDSTCRFDWPNKTREEVRNILGFFIGEPPVDSFAPSTPPGLVQAAAHPP